MNHPWRGILIRAAVAMIGNLPTWTHGLMASFVACIAPWLLPRDWRRGGQNVHRVFGLPSGSSMSSMFLKQCLRHQVMSALETLRMIREPSRGQVEGAEELARIVRECGGGPLIFATAHLGSWELCARYASQTVNGGLIVLAKPPREASLKPTLERMRRRMGINVLWTDRTLILRDMLVAIKEGRSLGFVMDQKPEGRRGPEVPFLGQRTEFVGGPGLMASRCGLPVVGIFLIRKSRWYYRIYCEKIGDGKSSDADSLTAACAAAIDRMIRLYPEQWTWSYKRWRDPQTSG